MLIESSCRDIEVPGFGEYLITEVLAEEAYGGQVDLLPKHPRQFFLYRKEGQPHARAKLELHQNVHIASGTEVIAQGRTEDRKPPNMVSPTKFSDPLARELIEVKWHD
jgi:hypothetical protein